VKTGIIEIHERPVETCADSISVGNPREGVRAIRAVFETEGGFIEVSDTDIYEAVHDLARFRGVLSEPAAAAAFAGFLNGIDSSAVSSEERVAVFLTGSGLKDIPAVRKAAGSAPLVIGSADSELDKLEGIMGHQDAERRS